MAGSKFFGISMEYYLIGQESGKLSGCFSRLLHICVDTLLVEGGRVLAAGFQRLAISNYDAFRTSESIE